MERTQPTQAPTSSTDIINFTCPICLNILINPVKTECSHLFCQSCLEEVMENSPSEVEFKCPMCRSSFKCAFELKVDTKLNLAIQNQFPKEYISRKKLLDEYLNTQASVVKIKFLYGNAHKLVENPKASRSSPDTQNKHSWSCFVKVQGGDISKYVRKVVFGMHPTFGTTEVEVKSIPFEISRIGWGTFEIPIKVYFHYSLHIKEPLELTHCLNFNGNGETKIYIYKMSKENYNKLNK